MKTTEQTEFTNKEQIYESIYLGRYDTPKKLNRSAKEVPKSFIDSIEDSTVTSNEIKNLCSTLPIYGYKTCITIHGNFPEIERTRIGGYKNIIQNKNGSLEIRYSGIDYYNKKELAKLLDPEFTRLENSQTGIYFAKQHRTTDKQEAIKVLQQQRGWINSININGFKAKISVSGYCYWGMYYVRTTIMPMLITEQIIVIASKLTGLSIEELTNRQEQIKQEEQKRERDFQETLLRLKESSEELDAKIKEALNVLSQKYKPAQIESSGTFVTVERMPDNKVAYKFIVTEKATFGRVRYKFHYSNNPEDFRSDLLKEGKKDKQVKPSEIAKRQTFKVC